jgi:uncharacterized protein (TIGR00297 family)
VTAYSETRRQIVHIAMAGFALLLPYLTWPQAALFAGGALAFNALLLARVAPGIIRPTDRAGVRAGVLFYPLSVLVLVLIFRDRLDFVAAAWGIMAFGDGFATLGGKAIGGPRLSWNREKTWSGLVTFVVAGTLGASWLVWFFVQRFDLLTGFVVPREAAVPTLWMIAAATAVAALVETVPIRVDDNLSVPAAAGGTLWFLSLLNWMPPLDALALDLLTGLLVSVPIAALAALIGRLSPGGAIIGCAFAVVIYASLYLAGLAVLALALALTILSSRAARERPGDHQPRGERRGFGNIVANCLVGTLGAALELFSYGWGLELAATWFVAGIAAGASDTVASEIGKAWGGAPRAFPTLRRVVAGTPGAVSIAGTIAGIIGAAVITLPAVLLWLIPASFVVPIVVACTMGAFAESALATRFEHDRVLDNNTLNFLNTALAAAVAVAWCSRLAGDVVIP